MNTSDLGRAMQDRELRELRADELDAVSGGYIPSENRIPLPTDSRPMTLIGAFLGGFHSTCGC
jgi:hypothetical protein